MPTVTRFFSNTQLLNKKRTLVNVGGHGDCGFRAVAAGLLDHFLISPQSTRPIINKILARHFVFFPAHRPARASSQLVESVLHKVKMSELIPSMAYTLRQIAVDEMVASPVHYPGAFVQDNEQTSPQSMRQVHTWIDESSICALAHALELPIEVHVVQQGKTLALPPLLYHPTAHDYPIVIELERQHYRPCLLKPASFSSDIYDCVQIPALVEQVVDDPDMQGILKQIAIAEAHVKMAYEKHHTRLLTMVNAGELSKDDLLNLYIKGMNRSDYLVGRVKHVDHEYQSDFFSRAIARPTHAADISFEDAMIAELVHALARAMSIGHLSAADVFLPLDGALEQRMI